MRPFEPHPLAHGLGDGADLALSLTDVYQPEASPWGTPAYRFDILRAGQRVGLTSLRIGDGDGDRVLHFAGHVGFAVDAPFRGHGLARRAATCLFPLALAHGMDPLWITCNPDNHASIATIERLGGVYVDSVDVPADYGRYTARGERLKHRYRLALSNPSSAGAPPSTPASGA